MTEWRCSWEGSVPQRGRRGKREAGLSAPRPHLALQGKGQLVQRPCGEPARGQGMWGSSVWGSRVLSGLSLGLQTCRGRERHPEGVLSLPRPLGPTTGAQGTLRPE